MQLYQKVLVVDIENRQRFETYVISTLEPNVICINSVAARLVSVGDKVIIMEFQCVEKVENGYAPKCIHVDESNHII